MAVAVEQLADVRERMLPMLRLAAEEYRRRVPDGYPVVVDDAEQGTIGIEIDPSYALYIVAGDDGLAAELYYRNSRTDARSSASREKFAGAPAIDRRPLPRHVSDQALRNLIAELMSRWNQQPGILFITDS